MEKRMMDALHNELASYKEYTSLMAY